MPPITEEDPFGPIKSDKKDAELPAVAVNRLHSKSDVDSSDSAQHHTLGIKHNQASPGDHLHDGRSSKPLLDGITLPTDTTTALWRTEVTNALKRLGAH